MGVPGPGGLAYSTADTVSGVPEITSDPAPSRKYSTGLINARDGAPAIRFRTVGAGVGIGIDAVIRIGSTPYEAAPPATGLAS